DGIGSGPLYEFDACPAGRVDEALATNQLQLPPGGTTRFELPSDGRRLFVATLLRTSSIGCYADVRFTVDCPDTPPVCEPGPTDTADAAPASGLHIGAPPFALSSPAGATSSAQELVVCPGDQVSVVPPAGATVGLGPASGPVASGADLVSPGADGAARFAPGGSGGSSVLVVDTGDTCTESTTTVDLVAGPGRSYVPTAPIPVELDTPSTIFLHPLTPAFFSLPADRPRAAVLTVGGSAIEAGTTVNVGIGPTVGGPPRCDPAVSNLCIDGPIRGVRRPGSVRYSPIEIDVGSDVRGDLFLSEGESILKAIESYDACPEVTLTLTLVPVADDEDCATPGDEDDNGLADCDDPVCAGLPACDEPGPEALCDDGVDNDEDGDTDCADADCAAAPVCGADAEIACADDIDNDGDGDTDCADEDCAGNEACEGCPFAEVALAEATLVDTTGLLNNFVCVENACGDILASFWDEVSAGGGDILYGYSAPFAAPGIALPFATTGTEAPIQVTIRQYSPSDMWAERGIVACVGDRFFNYSYTVGAPTLPAPPTETDAPLVVFAGLQPEEFGPPVTFPSDTTCPGGDCTPYLPRFFALDDRCEPEAGVAKVRVFNASPRMPSVTVHVTPRPEGTGSEYDIATSLPWGEATGWFALTPNVSTEVIAEWSFRAGGTTDEFENVLGYFPNVSRTAAEVPSEGTCSTIIVAYNEREPEREHAFLVTESPLTCSFWRNRSGDPPALWPACE
ncbi:MAG: hypothetical protein H6697_12340, partial [Myxococcales bacterium]|nr:hypothetical protein [Myxococcales bacterium]